MAAEARRSVLWLGLEIGDEPGYARYRAAMQPICSEYGGAFHCDFAVSEVLLGPPRIGRVFALSFPDAVQRRHFFDDPRYRAVRRAPFEPSVGAGFERGALDSDESERRCGGSLDS